MCSRPSGDSAPGRHQRPAHQDLAACRDLDLRPGQRHAGELARLGHHDLRARLGHPVGAARGDAVVGRPGEQLRRDRAAAEQHRAQAPGSVQARVAQPAQLGGHQGDQRHVAEGAKRLVSVEAVVDHRGGGGAGRADEDRQPGDVEQRQHAQPAIVRVGADARRRRGRRGLLVAHRQLHRLGLAGGARREQHRVHRGRVELGAQARRPPRSRREAPPPRCRRPRPRPGARCSASGRRVLSGTSAAPMRGAACISTAKSRPGARVVATRSPSPTPSAESRRAAVSASASSCA